MQCFFDRQDFIRPFAEDIDPAEFPKPIAGNAETIRKLGRDLKLFNDAAFDEVKQLLEKPPYFFVIRKFSTSGTYLEQFLLSDGLGSLLVNGSSAERQDDVLVWDVAPISSQTTPHPQEQMHIDGARLDAPFEVVSLSCLEPDQNGTGGSVIIDIDQFRALAGGSHPEMLERLHRELFPWPASSEPDAPFVLAPILDRNDRLRWSYKALMDGKRRSETRPDLVFDWDLVDRVHASLEETRDVHEFVLGAGDLLLINNRLCLHKRARIVDPTGSRRRFIRTQIQFNQ